MLSIAAVIILSACGGSDDDRTLSPVPSDAPLEQPSAGYTLLQKSRIFGFTFQNRYAYCPSAVAHEDGTTSLYFCGNPVPDVMIDNIYLLTLQQNMSHSTPVSVLQPGASGSWDNRHTCDPCVIRGKFKFDGTEYAYAMFYLGCSVEYYYNELGVAFSNSEDSREWVKYPLPLVSKSWETDGDQEYAPGSFSWGVGQPSAISIDKRGKVLLSYTLGDISGTRVMLRELDLSDMSSPLIGSAVTMAVSGLKNVADSADDYTCNTDIALDISTNSVLMIRPVQPNPATYPNYISSTLEIVRLSFDSLRSGGGSWERLYRLTPMESGYPRNHNACLERDEYGWISSSDEITFYYTVSAEEPDVSPSRGMHAEWTYDIWRGVVSLDPS